MTFKRIILLFWLAVGFGLLSLVSVFVLAEKGFLGRMPTVAELQNPKSDLASEIISSDGQTMGVYFIENRINVRYHELSPHLVNALVATEDERFREHPGIDVRGTLRAVAFLGGKGGASTITQQLAKMLFTRDVSQNMVKRILQKVKEWIIAAKLERYYTKDEIVTLYFNRFDFINNAVGVHSAARVYFNKTPAELEIHEAATLVGMAKNPSLFNPVRRPDTTAFRRNVVFSQMVRNEMITQAECDSLSALPLGLNYQPVDHREGLAPYFREILRQRLTTLLEKRDEDTDELLIAKADGTAYNIYTDGLKIYTTLDSRMQRYAEAAVSRYMGEYLQPLFSKELKKRKNFPFARLSEAEIAEVMSSARERTKRYRILTGKECFNCHRRGKFISAENINGVPHWVCNAEDCQQSKRALPPDSIDWVFDQPVPMKVFTWDGEKDTVLSPNDSLKHYKSFLQTGLMSLDPHTGHIKAWVGGINHHYFEYDHVMLSRRQVGSTFKPFIYALALQAGLSACHKVPNLPITFKRGEFGLLRDWTPTNGGDDYGYEVSLKYGLANSLNTISAWVMRRFTPEAAVAFARKCGIASPLDPVPSLVLGVADLSVHEMVSAYSTFANAGLRMEPIYLLRIEDNSGSVIYETEQNVSEAISPELAYKMLDIMMGVTTGERGGPENKVTGTAMRMHYDNPNRGYDGIPWDVQVAGKTGTTQGNSDGWFMGIVPDLVTGVWVGAEDRSVRFTSTDQGQGANTGLPIWCYFMKSVWADQKIGITQRPFDVPESLKGYQFECSQRTAEGGWEAVDSGELFE